MQMGTGCFEEEHCNALQEVVAALGCSRLVAEEEIARETKREPSFFAPSPVKIVIACPSLSLQHEHVESITVGPRSREQVAVHAASLMARQENITVTYSEGKFSVCKDKEKELLENLYQSFAILVHSRVRAYTTMIARHCTKLSGKDTSSETHVETSQRCIGKKLDRLLNAAHAIHLERMATTFEVENLNMDEDDSTTPLSFGFQIDLDLPASTAEKNTAYKMAIKVPGEVKGKNLAVVADANRKPYLLKSCISVASANDFLCITIDTDELLSILVQKASEVVDLLAELLTTDPSRSNTAPLLRSSSFLTMPPPKPRDPSLQAGLQLLSSAALASSPPVVSPENGAKPSLTPHAYIPKLILTDNKTEPDDDDFSQFSVDQCENIVDSIFCSGLDETVFGDPPSKKMKLESF